MHAAEFFYIYKKRKGWDISSLPIPIKFKPVLKNKRRYYSEGAMAI